MAKTLVITEKPSVARDIADVLGGFREEDGWFENDDWVVTFAVGHLFELLEPEEVDEKFKRWTLEVLPIIPERFGLKKKKGQSDRIRTIQKLAKRDDVDRVVNACDAGREGELIFREIAKFLEIQQPVFRLWLQSMTADAIRRGFDDLLPGSDLEGLAQAAECRAYTDWLIGMNATRVLTKRFATRKERTAWSAGRVQTPTLALLVDREFEVLAHIPEDYWRVTADFRHDAELYSATWFDPTFEAGDDDGKKDDRIFNEARARAIALATTGVAGAAKESRKPSKESAPPLFDLTSLQREANRRFSWSARRTLGAAQRCYERHKILTYPRTDSKCLPTDYRATVDGVLESFAGTEAMGPEIQSSAQRLVDGELENAGKIFDDGGVSDHFAIIPTGTLPREDLSGDDKRIFDLVLRRFLGAFHPAALWERVERVTEVSGESFRTRARALMEPGWRAVLAPGEGDESGPLPALVPGQSEASGVAVEAAEIHLEADETKPPPRISEARLLSLMENAGRQVEDEDVAAALHEKGIGTPATRAEVIENLIRKGYVVRVGKALRPTVKGMRLIDQLRRIQIDRLASPALTGEIEQHLKQVEQGNRTAADFMAEMEQYAREIVERGKTFDYPELYGNDEPIGTCPYGGKPVREDSWFYSCEKDPELPREAKADESCPYEKCPLLIWKDTSGRYIDRRAAQALLEDGKTGILDGFTARNGRTYKGHMEIDTDEAKVVVVSEGWNEEQTSDVPEYDVNEEPLAPCPFSEEECRVIETRTHFYCTTRLKADEEAAAFKLAKKAAKTAGEAPPEKPEPPDHVGFVLPRTVCKREVTRDEALYYLANGKTELLVDFTSRFGRPFSAILVLKENGKHGFEFPPRGKAADAGEAEGDGASKKATRKKAATSKTAKKATRKKTTRKKAAKATRKKATTQKSAAKTTRKKATRKKATRSKPPGASGDLSD